MVETALQKMQVLGMAMGQTWGPKLVTAMILWFRQAHVE
jgi:hypothetical protein